MATPRTKLPTATPEQFDGAVLMRVTESNLKIVRYVDISIDRTVTLLGGDNGNGKTTIIDGIDWVLGRKDVIQMDPIRHGKQEGSATLHFGDGETVTLKITKTLMRHGDKDFTAEVDVEIPGYLPPSRVQDFLEALKGKQSLDPMWFDRLEGKAQLLALRNLVADFDFDANKAAYDKLFKQRTDVKRDRDREQAAADNIVTLKEPPCEHVDEDALTTQLREAGEKNTELERRKSNREKAATRLTQLRDDARAKFAQVDTDVAAETQRCNDSVAELQEQIEQLQQRIRTSQENLATEVIRIRRDLTQEASEITQEADELQQKIEAAEALPKSVDTAELEQQISEARKSNKTLTDWESQCKRRKEYQAAADGFAKQADELTAQLTELQRAREDAILKAQLPIDGLGFADDHVTLHGPPWPQASEAQRIDASMAIAMAHQPKLRTILIRHASGVGTKIRERIRERAHERGYRVIMEIYDETGANSHIFVEDGLVKKIDGQDVPVVEQAPEPAAAERPALELSGSPPAPKSGKKPWRGPGAPTGEPS